MRIAVLTQPLRYNYGGILQNFALQTVLKRMGHIVVTLDPKRYSYPWWKQPYIALRIAVSRYIKKRSEVAILGEYRIYKRTRVLGTNTFKFINKYIKRREYTNLYDEVREKAYDAFIVGSDQVWRPEYNQNLTNMFLDFTEGWHIKRVAYAASFGTDEWNVSEKKTAICQKTLRKFDGISVREDSAITLCKNVFGVDAIHVLDPTMLLTKEDYISLLNLNEFPKSKGNLLVYILDETEDKSALINNIVEQFHAIPFRVNSKVEDPSAALEERIQPPVQQWLRGFMDADYVVTDSFHACVFSIIFRKPFVAYVNKGRGSSRYSSLFNILELNNDALTTSEDFNGFCTFSEETTAMIDRLRKKSFDFITNCFS